MPLNPRHLTPDYAVQGQVQAAEMAEIATAGFKSVINNRPDGEEPGQPTHQQLAAAAQEAGLAYVYIPVTMPILAEQAAAMREALDAMAAPVLAFCKSGGRSTRMWELAQNLPSRA